MTKGNFAHFADEFEPSGIDCVFLTCFDGEADVCASLLRPAGIRIHFADTLEEAEFLLIVTGATVLLCDDLFLDGSWRDAASMLENLHPGVRLVVVLDPGDRSTHGEYAGHCAALVFKPLRIAALRRAIEAASQTAAERHASAVV